MMRPVQEKQVVNKPVSVVFAARQFSDVRLSFFAKKDNDSQRVVYY